MQKESYFFLLSDSPAPLVSPLTPDQSAWCSVACLSFARCMILTFFFRLCLSLSCVSKHETLTLSSPFVLCSWINMPSSNTDLICLSPSEFFLPWPNPFFSLQFHPTCSKKLLISWIFKGFYCMNLHRLLNCIIVFFSFMQKISTYNLEDCVPFVVCG